MYMFAVVFLDGMAQYLIDTPPERIDQIVYDGFLNNWGSLGQAMLTLYGSITGGAPWTTVLPPVKETGEFYFILFLFYIALLAIAMLRLLTGLFVQEAASAAAKDHAQTIQQNII